MHPNHSFLFFHSSKPPPSIPQLPMSSQIYSPSIYFAESRKRQHANITKEDTTRQDKSPHIEARQGNPVREKVSKASKRVRDRRPHS